MTINTKTTAISRSSLAGLIIGAVVGAGIMTIFMPDHNISDSLEQEKADGQPLYWVAPMDDNYRRDKPGQSPMGMDLVPVYAEQSSNDDFGPGAVTIAPHVINNLGVRTAPVQLGTFHSEISTVGYVQYDENNLVHIHPRVEGWVETLFVKAAGDPVEKGQALYTLYSPQLVNAQEELLIALKRNNTTLINAAKQRLSSLQLSELFIKQLVKNREIKQSVTFYAPQSGVIDGLKIREGFYVNPGTTLMSIGQLENIWVEAEIFERDAALVQAGLMVSMTLDYLPGEQWDGVIDYVYPTLNPKTRTLRVRLAFDNSNLKLKPNMFAQVIIYADASENTLLVEKESVIRTGKQNRVVLALGDGRFKSVAVKIGRVNDRSIEIISGLEEDDVVVTSAQFLIDSESSKNSDFKRMSADEVPNTVWMQGEVNSVMSAHAMVNISHQPVAEWDWPVMTMDFNVAENLDINELAAGQSLHFEVTKTAQQDFEITAIHIIDDETVDSNNEAAPSATVQGVINSIATDRRVVNISRSAIEKWDRQAATMDFVVADNIDINTLRLGSTIDFTFEVRDDLVIVDVGPVDNHSSHNQDQ